MLLSRPTRRDWWLAFAYFTAAVATIVTTRFQGGVAFIWIATAILVPVLAHRPRRRWATPILMCAVASILATGLVGLGWRLALPFAVINMTEAALGAWLLTRQKARARNAFASLDWFWRFVLSVGVVAPLVAGSLAAAVMGLAGHSAWTTFGHYFVGHALGAISFIPLFNLIVSGEIKALWTEFRQRRMVETTGLLLLVAVTTAVTFASHGLPLLFLPCGPIILAIFRGRQIGAAISIVLVAVIGGSLTAAGHGPISLMDAAIGERMQFFQFYLASVVLTVLPVAADLAKRSKLHRDLRYSEERHRMLAEHSSDILMHVEVDGVVRFVSPAIRQIGGYEPHELIGQRPMLLVAPEDRDKIRAEHQAALDARGGTRTFDYRALTKDGQARWFETHSRAIVDRNGQVDGILSVIRDVSARKAVEARLTAAALTDPLTGLPNRRAFLAAAAAAVPAPGRTTCIAVIDIDHFKRVNDVHGHDGGDAVLVQLGKVARQVVRSGDMVARLGGEEFALLLTDTSLDDAVATCERLRREIAAMGVPTRTGMIRVTISGGVADMGRDGLDEAVKRADLALYAAKAGGRDQLKLAA